jgi:hypothetical protein
MRPTRLARDVQALPPVPQVAVTKSFVAASIDHARHRLNPEVEIVVGSVEGQSCARLGHMYAVVAVLSRHIALNRGCTTDEDAAEAISDGPVPD